jgi:hypothetical protein
MSNIESFPARRRPMRPFAPTLLGKTPLRGTRSGLWARVIAMLVIMWGSLYADAAGSPGRVAIGVESWLSAGSGSWEVSHGMPASFESRLAWQDLDSHAWLLRATWQPAEILRLSAACGTGSIPDGSNTDSDRVAGSLTQQSVSETDGDLSLLEISLDLFVNEAIELDPEALDLALRLGFLRSSERLTDQNDLWSVRDGRAVREQYSGDNASYDFEWSALQLGLAATRRLGSQLTFNADASWLVAKHNGEGFWMTNSAFEGRDPNLENSARGHGALVNIGLAWWPRDNVSASLGWRWLHLEARNGEHTQYLAGGSRATATLDEVTSERSGLTAAVHLQF